MLMQTYALLAQLTNQQVDVPKATLDGGDFKDILRFVAAMAGGISVIVVAYGGLKYALSRGNPQETKTAINTILYALAGLVISITSFGIISFVVTNI